MAVRNFWIDCDIDGRETTLSGGPRAKDGGMFVVLKMRDKGVATKVGTICCSEHEGKLRMVLRARGEEIVVETER